MGSGDSVKLFLWWRLFPSPRRMVKESLASIATAPVLSAQRETQVLLERWAASPNTLPSQALIFIQSDLTGDKYVGR